MLQTALQAREMGLAVHVIEDCAGSRRRDDKAGLALHGRCGLRRQPEMAVLNPERAGTPFSRPSCSW
ncbi:hypothetical protein HS125_20390 [bacterium]|nr:hypothetical protein [bacterium]